MVFVRRVGVCCFVLSVELLGILPLQAATEQIDLTRAVVVVSSGERGQAEKMAATILVEEVAKRTGLELPVVDRWPKERNAAIAICTRDCKSPWASRMSEVASEDSRLSQPEGFAIRVATESKQKAAAVYVIGADSRGAMFGVGRLLRELECSDGTLSIDASFESTSAPEYSARGHELGYRARANSYDAWSRGQYDQYIREQVIFGMNCVQGIPFQDSRRNELMQYSRQEMNRMLGEICARYDVDYWVWTPVEFLLMDEGLRKAELKRHEEFYRSTPRLDAVFVPGGDPGENPPELVLPFMEDLGSFVGEASSSGEGLGLAARL